MNWEHVYFTNSEANLFLNSFDRNYLNTEEEVENFINSIGTKKEKYQDLSAAEKKAINHFTGGGSKEIYGLFAGYLTNILPKEVKEILAFIAMLASGLNKIPLEKLQRNGLACHGGGSGIVSSSKKKFISTSINLKTCDRFLQRGKKPVMLYFDQIYGRDISGLSMLHEEEEYLITPSNAVYDYRLQHAKTTLRINLVAPRMPLN